MKYTYLLVLTWLWLCLFESASAQTIKSINVEPDDKLINQGVNISIDFTSEKKPWCGLRVDWGNGKTQPVRVGHDGDEGAPTSPIKLSNTYSTAGKYNISVKGELLIRGLTGTATPCEVKASPTEILVVDPETDTKYIAKSWASYLSALPPLHLQCMQVGLAVSDIKYEAIDDSGKPVSMNSPVSKRVIERCQHFVKAIHPKPNVPCKIKGEMGFLDTVCDQAYGQKMEDGSFKTFNIEEAIKLHIQSKSWVVVQRETQSGKETRLANEAVMKEKEKQRVLELERQKAAQLKALKEADEQRALEAERQKAAELKTKKDAEEALLRIWRDAGFAPSQFPYCPQNGEFNNCFGSGKDASGNEYFGEFKSNALVGRGIVIYSNHDRYIGYYDGGRNGEGIYYYLAESENKGMIFVGQYKNEIQKGLGIYFDRNGNVFESGMYDHKLIEFKYVDPGTFTRIPSGKIPVISADARLKIQIKQATIAKEQAERQRAAVQAAQEAREREEKRRSEIAAEEQRLRDEYAKKYPYGSPEELGRCYAVIQWKIKYKTSSLKDGEIRFLQKVKDRLPALDNAVERSRPACLSVGNGYPFLDCMRGELKQDEYDYFFGHETALASFQKDSFNFEAIQGLVCNKLFQ